ncbi:MAG: hypothetical protein KDA41_08280 [Planctomycetales bacterium]|nr:hypothetical protein [Planctomycetales bacterium]
MSIVEINRRPAARELRTFGALLGVFTVVMGAVVFWRTESAPLAWTAWATGGLLCVVYWAVPAWRRGLYLAWMFACFPVAWLSTHLLLGGVYYLLITPIGRLMRCLGHDPMRRRLDRQAKTYWISRTQSSSRSRYFRQF